MDNDNRDEQLVPIDVEQLARRLAVDVWEQDTKLISSRDLWEKVVKPDGEVVEEVRSKWSTLYWNLVTQYKNLILEYGNNEIQSQT